MMLCGPLLGPAKIPTDAALYKDVFNDAVFWDANLDEDLAEEMLYKRVQANDGYNGDIFWEPLLQTRWKTIETAIRYKDCAPETAHLAVADSQPSQADEPLKKWLVEDDTEYKNAVIALSYIRRSLDPKLRPKTIRESILRELGHLHDTTKEKHVRKLVTTTGDSTFFVGIASFRHRGESTGKPAQVVLKDSEVATTDTVLVYASESGTGKTIELAGNAHARKGVLSIICSRIEDLKAKEAGKQRTDECIKTLRCCLKEAVESNDRAFTTIINAIKAWKGPPKQEDEAEAKDQSGTATGTATVSKEKPTQQSKPVRIVVCVDEASMYPTLVREIIRNHKQIGEELGKYIQAGCGDKLKETSQEIEVVFSLAGTGAYGVAIGSQGTTYEVINPSARHVDQDVYNALLAEYDKKGRIPKFDQLVEANLLGIIVQHNARMASILIDQISISMLQYTNPNEEARLMARVFNKFMRCNGLKELLNNNEKDVKAEVDRAIERMLVASQALAALLYQRSFELGKDDAVAEKLVERLDYVIKFQHFGDLKPQDGLGMANPDDTTVMEVLVGTYGLVAPKVFPPGEEESQTLEEPFQVSEAMQLLCVWLLQSGTRLKDADDFLGTTPFAFELLSTQLVSCVISAAMTVEEKERKDVPSILTETLQMFSRESVDPQHKGWYLDGEIKEAWDALEGVIPVSAECKLALDGMYHHKCEMWLEDFTETQEADGRQKKVGQVQKKDEQNDDAFANIWQNIQATKIKRGEAVDLGKVANLDSFDVEAALRDKTEILAVDKDFVGGLADIRRMKMIVSPGRFIPPLTTVAEGSSNLADGCVSFVGAKWRNGTLVDHALYTICIQSKDYFGSSAVDNDKVRENKNRVYHDLLDIPFGENRLYCLATRLEKFAKRKISEGHNAMPYVSYPVDKGKLLPSMMSTLDKRRNRHEKIANGAIAFTLDG